MKSQRGDSCLETETGVMLPRTTHYWGQQKLKEGSILPSHLQRQCYIQPLGFHLPTPYNDRADCYCFKSLSLWCDAVGPHYLLFLLPAKRGEPKLSRVYGGHFLGWCLMKGGPAHCRWCHWWADGPGLPKKAAWANHEEQAQHSSVVRVRKPNEPRLSQAVRWNKRGSVLCACFSSRGCISSLRPRLVVSWFLLVILLFKMPKCMAKSSLMSLRTRKLPRADLQRIFILLSFFSDITLWHNLSWG